MRSASCSQTVHIGGTTFHITRPMGALGVKSEYPRMAPQNVLVVRRQCFHARPGGACCSVIYLQDAFSCRCARKLVPTQLVRSVAVENDFEIPHAPRAQPWVMTAMDLAGRY